MRFEFLKRIICDGINYCWNYEMKGRSEMKRRKKHGMKRIVSGSLILSFLLALFPSAEALAAMAPMEERAGQKAAYYQKIIMRDVPECTWDADTQPSHTTALYDLSGNVNGYIYEYVNGEEPVGFLQIDVSMGEPALDSYTFGDEHCAARELRNLPAAICGKKDTEKLVYLGGYAYYLLGETDEEGKIKAYDVLNHRETELDRLSAVKTYEEDVMAKRQMRLERVATRSGTMSTRGANTITKFVQGYTSKRLATYNNVADSSHAGCAAIAGTNICMYWAVDRGKSKLVQTMKSTFDELYVDMKVNPTNGLLGGSSSDKAYAGLKQYINRKGYSIPNSGKAAGSNYSWNWAVERIDRGMPYALPVYDKATLSSTSVPHCVAVFGYQYIEIENTLIVADGNQNSLIYKVYSQYANSYGEYAVNYDGAFAFYVGW